MSNKKRKRMWEGPVTFLKSKKYKRYDPESKKWCDDIDA